MLIRKKSKARIKADAKIRQLKRQYRDLDRKLTIFFLLFLVLVLLWFGLPFVLCIHLIFVWDRPAHEALLTGVIWGIIFPFLFLNNIRKLAAFGERIIAEYEMRKWLKRRGIKSEKS